MKTHALIFGLDGSLNCTSIGILLSNTASFIERGVNLIAPLPKAPIRSPLKKTLFYLCSKLYEATLDQLTVLLRDYYDTHGFQENNRFRRVAEMLQALYAAKIPLHIATNKRHRPTPLILEVLGWTKPLDQVVSPSSCKPHLQSKFAVLASLLPRINMEAQECLRIADQLDDYKAAREVGIQPTLAEWCFEENSANLPLDTINLNTPKEVILMSLFPNQTSG